MEKKTTLKTRLMNWCETFGKGAEFTWTQLHEFMVLETLKSNPGKIKFFYYWELPEEYHNKTYGSTNFVKLTYEECIDLYFKKPRIFRGFMTSPLSNLGTYYDRCKNNYMRHPSKNEPRYLVKNANGKYTLNTQKNFLTLDARYGLKHDLEIIDENTYRAYDFNRLSYDKIDEDGKFVNVGFIDFDGGPFLPKGYSIPKVENKIIKEFKVSYKEDNLIDYIDIILE